MRSLDKTVEICQKDTHDIGEILLGFDCCNLQGWWVIILMCYYCLFEIAEYENNFSDELKPTYLMATVC